MKNGEDFRKTFNDFWEFVDEYVEKGKEVELKMKVLRKMQMKIGNPVAECHVGDQIAVKLPGQKMTATCHKVTDQGALFVFDDCITRHQMNDTDTNEGGYAESDLCEWLNNELFEMFPDKLKRKMQKFSDGSMVRLLTYGEVFGSEDIPSWVTPDGNEQLPLMKDRRNRIAFIDDEWCWWWLQNPCSDVASNFAYVNYNGFAYAASASNSGGVRPAFLIA